MGRISLELVPRDRESFTDELELVKKEFPLVDTLNIPDILKFDMRIPEACEIAEPYYPSIIPHIRAVSIHREKPFSYKEFFLEHNIDEVLVILGDNTQIVSKSECPCTSVELIRKIKDEMPHMTVYAGIDQWRTTFKEELDYIDEKVKAGADGFFTQPFFDLELLETYARELSDLQIFFGLAPVVKEFSRNYWETKNNVVFPELFECTLEWNRNFAKEVIEFTRKDNFHVYFCPITVDLVDYLSGIV